MRPEQPLGESISVKSDKQKVADFLIENQIQTDPSDPLKPLETKGGERITYKPVYFDAPGVPFKETSRIVPYTNYDGKPEAIAVKEGSRTRMIIDVTRLCSGTCPPCLNAMYDATMPETMKSSGTARKLKGGNSSGQDNAETILILKAFTGMTDGYFTDIKAATQFATERAGVNELTLTGGEPTIIGNKLIRLLDTVNDQNQFRQIKLFTHAGPLLTTFKHWEPELKGVPYEGNMLQELVRRGVTELTISRHHDDETINFEFMGKSVPSDEKLKAIIDQAHELNIPVRFSTLVEKGYIETIDDIERFARWAKEIGVDEIIFRALAQTGAVDTTIERDVVSEWVQNHLVSFSDISEAMSQNEAFIQLEEPLEQNIKSRVFYSFNDLPVTLEFKHDPGELKTDAGVLTAFPDKRTLPDGSEENVTLSYRWVRPQDHAINYKGEDWTDDEPYFRPGEQKVDIARKHRVTKLGEN